MGEAVMMPHQGESPIVNITGEQVALGPMRRDLLPLLCRWGNDLRIRLNFDFPETWSLESAARMFDDHADSAHEAFFTLYERHGASGTEMRPIGFTYLTDIDLRHRTAEFGIMIGEADARGRGYGTEATRLMLDYAFTALGLHNVMLHVYAYNRAGRRAYEKAGFREFARRRESKMLGGKWWDQIYMQCLATDFVSPVLSRVLTPDEER